MTEDKPWQDRETLRKLYVDDELSAARIAEKFDGITRNGIYYWLDKHDIQRRSKSEAATIRQATNLPSMITDVANGYEKIESTFQEDRDVVPIHRLLAVAEYGFEAVCEADDVHHWSRIEWDNRPINVVPLSRSEHVHIHKRLALGIETIPKSVVGEVDR